MSESPVARRLNEASVIMEGTPHPELVAMLRMGAEEIQRLWDQSEKRWYKIQWLEGRVENLEAFIAKPPQHRFWGAGEADCPRDIKAGNGELHTLRCKDCGQDSPREDFCRATLDGGASR